MFIFYVEYNNYHYPGFIATVGQIIVFCAFFSHRKKENHTLVTLSPYNLFVRIRWSSFLIHPMDKRKVFYHYTFASSILIWQPQWGKNLLLAYFTELLWVQLFKEDFKFFLGLFLNRKKLFSFHFPLSLPPGLASPDLGKTQWGEELLYVHF